ncbi:MAG: Holliday junction resolvase RuvX [Rhodospirillales bacterium]
MPVLELAAFVRALPPGEGRVLGLDIGARTIGLALSDARRRVASPLETMRRSKRFADDAQHLRALAEKHAIAGLVAGWPLEMSGREGARAQAARQTLKNIAEALGGPPGGLPALPGGPAPSGGLPALLWDERLSSQAVERVMIEDADMPRKRRREVIDKSAAAWILQGALDAAGNL